MLDRRFVLENLEEVRENCVRRGVSIDLDRFVTLEEERKRLQQKLGLVKAGICSDWYSLY